MKYTTRRIYLLPEDGEFYKLNLHTHSKLSDGNFTPEELKQLYMDMGYDGLAYTDHRKCIPHTQLTDGNFVALTGMELDFTEKDEKGNWVKSVHINALAGDPAKCCNYESMPLDYSLINQTVAQLKKDGFYVVLNHPVWSNMTNEEVAKIKGMDAMEICNSIAVWFNNYSDDSSVYETYMRQGGRVVPVAADDTHKIFEDGTPFWEYGKSFTMVKARELTYSTVMEALRRGHSYASTGPEIKAMWIEGNTLHIECSPVFGIFVHGMRLDKKTQVVEKSDCIISADIDITALRQSSPYFWVQLRTTDSQKAWATPYWF